MKAIAIDDEPIALSIVRAHCSKVPFLDLKAEFTDAFKALEYLQTHTVDIIFLDIKMPDISGIDFLKSLNNKPLIIFTTAYSEHAVASFELDAVDYLLKPFSLPRFTKACNKAFELYNFRNRKEPQNFMFVKSGYEQVKICFDEIYYLEAAGNYVNFATTGQNILSRMTFNDILSLLPENQFVRVHRSYIAALSKIDKIEKHQLSILDIKIPVGEAYSQNLAALINQN